MKGPKLLFLITTFILSSFIFAASRSEYKIDLPESVATGSHRTVSVDFRFLSGHLLGRVDGVEIELDDIFSTLKETLNHALRESKLENTCKDFSGLHKPIRDVLTQKEIQELPFVVYKMHLGYDKPQITKINRFSIKNGDVLVASLIIDFDTALEGVTFADFADLNEDLFINFADLNGALFIKTNLKRVNLQRADLREANLIEADLREAILRGAFLEMANLRDANLREAKLGGAYLNSAILTRANLREANLTYTILTMADLREANLEGADLSYTNLRRANLYHANLIRANIYRADLRETDLRETDLRETDLRETDLRETDLRGASFYMTNLEGANLTKANLTGVSLYMTNLTRANLTGTIVSQAELDQAIGVTSEQRAQVIEPAQ